MLSIIVTYILPPLIKLIILLAFAIILAAVLTWMERRQSAMMQDRIGPERAYLRPPLPGKLLGRWRLWGLIHPLADALKLATKEDFIPPKAHRWLYSIAPLLTLVPVLLVFAVIPFGPPVCLDQLTAIGPDPRLSHNLQNLQVATLDVGLLFVFAIASIASYGAALAGWSSNSAYGLLGGMRATAQMFSYEITMGMTVMGAFLVYGTLEPMALVEKQASLGQWGIVTQPLGFILFFVAVIAETKRAPFDLPEGESEILGFFVEYSGARFMMFYLAEFIEIVFAACMIVTLFLGGWQLPGLHAEGLHWFGGKYWPMQHWLVVMLQVGTFMAKVFIVCFLQLAVRWSVPRMRYDQLMKLGWKGLLPASLANVVITALVVLYTQGVR
jgi:NADH-quinone oxidoreductase subunit H